MVAPLPTQSVTVRRSYYLSGTPIPPVFYDDLTDAQPNTPVLDTVLAYDGSLNVIGYYWNGIQQVPNSGSNDPIGNALRAAAIAYWKLDEASGARVDSKSTNTLNVLNNDLAISGKISNALKINSVSGYARKTTTNLNLYPESWSIAFWLYYDELNGDLAEHPIMGKYDDNPDNWEWGFYQNNDTDSPAGGRLSFYSFNNAVNTQNQPNSNGYLLADGSWYFVILEYDVSLTKLRLYINNVFDNQTDIAVGDINVNNGPFSIGAADGETHKFRVDELLMISGVFIQEQRDYLWNSGSGVTLYP